MNQAVQPDGRKTRHAQRRGEVLEAAADYVSEHGLEDLSVRDLAAGVGLSHRTLLYHFGTKEQLLREVMDRVRARDKEQIRAHLLRAEIAGAPDLLRAAWASFSAPEREPYMRLFHQVVARGLAGPPWDAWVRQVVTERIGGIATALQATGLPADRATAVATLVVAAVRGLQLQLLATGDRDAVDAAFEALVESLSSLLPS